MVEFKKGDWIWDKRSTGLPLGQVTRNAYYAKDIVHANWYGEKNKIGTFFRDCSTIKNNYKLATPEEIAMWAPQPLELIISIW